MKKTIIIFIITFITLSLYSARNEEEQGPPPLYKDKNDEINEEQRVFRNKKNYDGRGEDRTFRELRKKYNSKKHKHRKKDELNVPWSDNGRKRRKRRKKYANYKELIKAKLSLKQSDIIIKANKSYLDLYIRKKPEIKSILLTTATGDFTKNRQPGSEYALRSMNYVKENGNELFFYKGRFLGKAQKLFFLITSSLVKHDKFKKAFYIKIPRYVVYGYKWENFGTMRMAEGTKFNIRTFAGKFANYRRGYADNVITLNLSLYSGKDFYKPSISIYKLGESNSYVVIFVEYKDNNRYFKNFLVSENGKEYKEIYFSKLDIVRDLRGILIYSKYDIINKKIVKFKFYIEKKSKAREIEITGSDPSGNKPDKPIKIKIPEKGISIRNTIRQEGINKKPEEKPKKTTESKTEGSNNSTPPSINE